VDTEFDGAKQIGFQRGIELAQFVVLARGELDLRFERTVQLDQLRVHGLGGFLQPGVLADELVALNGVFQRGDEFLVQPRLDNEPEYFTLVDRGDDRVEIEHGRRQDTGGERLDLPRFGQQFEAGQLRHQLVGDDNGKFPAREFGERLERGTVGDGLVTSALERLLERGQKNLFVIHDQNWIVRMRDVVRRVHTPRAESGRAAPGGNEAVGTLKELQVAAGFAEVVELFAGVAERGL